MLDIANSKLKPEYMEQKGLVIVSRRKAGIIKSKKELGFESETDLKSGLKELIEWRKEQHERN